MLGTEDALWGARMLRATSVDADINLRAIYQTRVRTPIRFMGRPERQSPGDLRIGIVVNEDDIADFFICGIENEGQANLVVRGYTAILPSSPEGTFNSYFWAVAADVFRGAELARNLGGVRAFRLWGHSAGGGVVEVAAKIMDRHGLPIHSVCTYGAPKPGVSGSCLDNVSTHRNRYMNYNDYVPMIPHAALRREDPRSIALDVLLRNAAPWRCTHGSGGILVTSRAQRPAIDAQGDRSPLAGVQAWLYGERPVVDAHSIDAYVRVLSSLAVREMPLAPPPVTTFPPLRPPVRNALVEEPNFVLEMGRSGPPSSPGIGYVLPINIPLPETGVPGVAAIVQADRLLLADGSTVPVTREGRKMAQAKLRGRLKMKYVNAGSAWVVVWNDFLIATFSRPSSAKTFCSAGNRFLRLMRNNGALYMPIFVEAFTSWITIAAAGDPDYQPPLVVNP